MQYRRSQAHGATFFFTVTTYKRKRILCHKANVTRIKEAFLYVIKQNPFRIQAFVLLPDYLHGIWTLPENDNAFSMQWRLIKSYFSRRCMSKYKYLMKMWDMNNRSCWVFALLNPTYTPLTTGRKTLKFRYSQLKYQFA